MGRRSKALRNMAVVLLILTSVSLASVLDATASHAHEGTIVTRPGIPVTLVEGLNRVLGEVNFGRRFRHIESVCFVFEFRRNLLEVGEGVEIALDHDAPPNSGFGFYNPGPEAQDSRTICSVTGYHDEELALYKDGRQDFVIRMFEGSVRISNLRIVLTGR